MDGKIVTILFEAYEDYMNLKKLAVGLILGAVSLVSVTAYGTAPNPGDFNVYAIHDIGTSSNPYSNADFQGITGAGGNIYLQNFSINANGTSTGSPSVYAGQTFNINSGQINNGGIEAAGNIGTTNTSTFGNVNGGGNLTGSGGQINGNVHLAGTNSSSTTISGTVTQNSTFSPTANLSQISSYFLNTSATFAGNSQSPWVNTSISFGTLNVTGLQSGYNYINITLATEETLSQIQLSGNSHAIVIFNIDGTPGSMSQALKGVTINGLSSSSILFNIRDATNLTMTGGPYDSILAPNSNITFTNGAVEGNLIANNLYGTGQVNTDQGLFTGFPSVSAPEPSTYAILASMLGVVAFIKRKKISLKVKAL